MKRAGNLFDNIAESENLRLAFWKARRGKLYQEEVREFQAHLNIEIARMRQELLDETIKIGKYHYFTIHDPKERVICAADFRERVLHHAIMNVCDSEFERFQIFDSYASRKGKGVDACLKRTMDFCRLYRWYLKLDIHKYFDSIHHDVLLRILDHRFKDARLMALFTKIINSYQVTEKRGIPIGNLSSQYFANLYLGVLDHQVKDAWKLPGFIRYMDDFLIFHDDKNVLLECFIKIRDFLADELQLQLNPFMLNRCVRGVPFLSYVVLPGRLWLSQKARHRFRKKIKPVNKMEDQERALALLAFLDRADSGAFRASVFKGR